ncbi:hypothetical protein G6M89_12590 [Natronolimnobius sp. AArcel1]|uniref:hypothetical protein n=1 Tax=Natronolimnobius sp. AArcel1 TaxID=1679093 RepID=UPI0013EBB389|nr:hypothetical protein [Natronolimnobius sp. AArcel1]NGM69836.1 hypothetical protein [Natronolimnobius sp. AArcel1]
MADDTDRLEEQDRVDGAALEDDPTDSFDLEYTERIRIGVSRGEEAVEVGPPREYPDRADIAVQPVSSEEARIGLSIDAMAGDHATGHVDVELTPAEAQLLRDRLNETVRWVANTADDKTAHGENSSSDG